MGEREGECVSEWVRGRGEWGGGVARSGGLPIYIHTVEHMVLVPRGMHAYYNPYAYYRVYTTRTTLGYSYLLSRTFVQWHIPRGEMMLDRGKSVTPSWWLR